jgi:hypothetical protein
MASVPLAGMRTRCPHSARGIAPEGFGALVDVVDDAKTGGVRAGRLEQVIEATPAAVCPLGEGKGSRIVDEDRRSAIV